MLVYWAVHECQPLKLSPSFLLPQKLVLPGSTIGTFLFVFLRSWNAFFSSLCNLDLHFIQVFLQIPSSSGGEVGHLRQPNPK